MQKTMKFAGLCIFTAALNLTGCIPAEPTVFGVPQSQWNQLTPEQKNQTIAGYNQRQQTATQNAPLIAAIGAASDLIQNQQHINENKKIQSDFNSFNHDMPSPLPVPQFPDN